MNKRVIRRHSSSYYRQERHNYIMIIIVWLAIIGTCYYGVLGVKCIRHYQDLTRGHVATIQLFGGD